MGKKLKPGQRCTNSAKICGPEGHYFHKPFDKLALTTAEAARCEYVQPAATVPDEALALALGEVAAAVARMSPEDLLEVARLLRGGTSPGLK